MTNSEKSACSLIASYLVIASLCSQRRLLRVSNLARFLVVTGGLVTGDSVCYQSPITNHQERLDRLNNSSTRPNAQTMRDSLGQFSQIVEIATPEEKKALIPRIVESVTFTPTEIKIALFDHSIERGLLKLSPERNHFCDGALEFSDWLPRPDSNQ